MRALGAAGLVLSLGLVSALVSLPEVATAEEATDEQALAQQLFEQGVRAADDGDFESAVEAFAQSQALQPLPGTLANLALYQQETGRLVEARRSWALLLERHGAVISATARERAERQLAELDAQLSGLSIAVRPEGAAVSLDGEPVGAPESDGLVRVQPGPHVIEARLEGYAPERREVTVDQGESRQVVMTLQPIPASPFVERETAGHSVSRSPIVAPEEREPEPRAPPSFWSGPWPSVIGAAVVVLAGGIAVGAALWPSFGAGAGVGVSSAVSRRCRTGASLRCAVLAAAAVAVCSGCAEPRALRVVIDSDLDVPEELDAIEVVVTASRSEAGDLCRPASRRLALDDVGLPTLVLIEVGDRYRLGPRSGSPDFSATTSCCAGRSSRPCRARARSRSASISTVPVRAWSAARINVVDGACRNVPFAGIFD